MRNGARYLDAALESISNQSIRNIEILVAEDGSQDETSRILEFWRHRDRRVVILDTGGTGIVNALNRLADLARGEYLVRMDADDIAAPDRIAQQVKFLDCYQEYVAVGSAIDLIDCLGRVIGPSRPPTCHDVIDASHLRGHVAMTHPAVTARRSAFELIGGYRHGFPAAEDLDLWLRLAEVGRLANLPQKLLRYRLHEASVSSLNAAEQLAGCRAACRDAALRRGMIVSVGQKANLPGYRELKGHALTLHLGWRAWSAGQVSTWRYYARRAVMRRPWSVEAWRLVVFGALRQPSLENMS